jgi:hypothetical protein
MMTCLSGGGADSAHDRGLWGRYQGGSTPGEPHTQPPDETQPPTGSEEGLFSLYLSFDVFMLQVSEPIMHSIEVSGAAIKEAQRQVRTHTACLPRLCSFVCIAWHDSREFELLGIIGMNVNCLAYWSVSTCQPEA